MRLKNWKELAGDSEIILLVLLLILFAFAPLIVNVLVTEPQYKFTCQGDTHVKIYEKGKLVDEYLAWGTTYFDSSKNVLVLPAKEPVFLNSNQSIEIECRVRR